MNSSKTVETPSFFRRRFITLSLVLCLLFCVGTWWFGVWGTLAHYYANRLAFREQLFAADRWYQTAVKLGDDTDLLWFHRARLARKLARDEDFLEFLQLAVDRGLLPERAKNETYLAQGQRGDLSQLDRKFASLLIENYDSDEVCYAFVQGCIIKYRLDDAHQVLSLWEADFPQDARPHLLRGRLLEHRVNLEGAIAEFEKALQKNSSYAAAAYNLGRVLETSQKPESAIVYYSRCATSLGNPIPGLVAQARCQRLLQQYQEAERTLDRAMAASEEHLVEAFQMVGDPIQEANAKLPAEQGYLAAIQDQHQEAVKYLGKSITTNPNDWRVRYQLALSQKQIGEIQIAQDNLQIVEETKAALDTCDRLFDVLQREPANVEARLQIGKVFLEHLSENQGLVWLNSVLDLEPANVEAHRVLAEYFQKNKSSNPEFSRLAQYHSSYLVNALPAEE